MGCGGSKDRPGAGLGFFRHHPKSVDLNAALQRAARCAEHPTLPREFSLLADRKPPLPKVLMVSGCAGLLDGLVCPGYLWVASDALLFRSTLIDAPATVTFELQRLKAVRRCCLGLSQLGLSIEASGRGPLRLFEFESAAERDWLAALVASLGKQWSPISSEQLHLPEQGAESLPSPSTLAVRQPERAGAALRDAERLGLSSGRHKVADLTLAMAPADGHWLLYAGLGHQKLSRMVGGYRLMATHATNGRLARVVQFRLGGDLLEVVNSFEVNPADGWTVQFSVRSADATARVAGECRLRPLLAGLLSIRAAPHGACTKLSLDVTALCHRSPSQLPELSTQIMAAQDKLLQQCRRLAELWTAAAHAAVATEAALSAAGLGGGSARGQQLVEGFEALDLDNSGTVEPTEVAKVFAKLGVPSEQRGHTLERLRSIDRAVGFEEFVELLTASGEPDEASASWFATSGGASEQCAVQ